MTRVQSFSYVEIMASLDEANAPPGGDRALAALVSRWPRRLRSGLDVGCNTGAYSYILADLADVAIVKTSSPTGPVSSGATLDYTLVVTNNGPGDVTGTVVTDTPDEGLNCPASNPVTITGDGVPAGGPFTIANLTGAGIVLGALEPTQSASLTYTCTVE